MIVAIPVHADGTLDPRWGRAQRVAIADVRDGEVVDWTDHEVGWGEAHDQGPEGSHHARIARFLRDHHVEAVVADHVGAGMRQMLTKMQLHVVLGAEGDARAAAAAAWPGPGGTPTA